MSLSGEAHGSGTEYGTVGYDKKRHGQLLLFPKSLKAFADARIIGVKYALLAEERPSDEKEPATTRKKSVKKPKEKTPKHPVAVKPAAEKATKKKKADPKPKAKKLIPFPAGKTENFKLYVRQAMRALEKGNSVAAYNILKRIIPDP